MCFKLFFKKCDETDPELSGRVASAVISGEQAVVLLYGRHDCDDDFLRTYMNVNSSELTGDELELLSFSRNIISAFDISGQLFRNGIRAPVFNIFLTEDELQGLKDAGPDFFYRWQRCKKAMAENKTVIFCVSKKKNHQGECVRIEDENAISGAIAVPFVNEFKVEFSDDFSKKSLFLFETLANENISLDMINICYNELYFICNSDHAKRVAAILKDNGFDFCIKNNLAKLSFRGLGMKGTPGIMYSIYKNFESHSIKILRTTDSHTTISCLLEQSSLEDSLRLLESCFSVSANGIEIESG